MQGYLKELRYPITGLAILLLVSILVLVQRRELRLSTERLEVLVIADLLLELSEDKAEYLGAKVDDLPDDNNQGYSPSDAQRETEAYLEAYGQNREAFGSLGAIEVLGQLSQENGRLCRSKILLPAVGWLYLSTAPTLEPTFQRMVKGLLDDEIEWNHIVARVGEAKAFQPDAKLAAVVGEEAMPRAEIIKNLWEYIGDNKLQDAENPRRINFDKKLSAVFGDREGVSFKHLPELVDEHIAEAPGETGEPPRALEVSKAPPPAGRELYFLEARIEESSDVIFPGARYIFSNVQIEEDPADFSTTHGVPGAVTVSYWDDHELQWSPTLGQEAIRVAAFYAARKAGVTELDLMDAYRVLRSNYERQEVSLPLLEVNVSAASFLGFAYATSIALAAWASFLLRTARHHKPEQEDEPWIMVEPFRRLRLATGFDRPVAVLEMAMFCIFHFAAFVTPIVLGVLFWWTSAPSLTVRLLAIATLLVATMLSGAMLRSYKLVLEHALRHGPRGTAMIPASAEKTEARAGEGKSPPP